MHPSCGRSKDLGEMRPHSLHQRDNSRAMARPGSYLAVARGSMSDPDCVGKVKGKTGFSKAQNRSTLSHIGENQKEIYMKVLTEDDFHCSLFPLAGMGVSGKV